MAKKYFLTFLLVISFFAVSAQQRDPDPDQDIRLFPNPVNNVFGIEYQDVKIIRVEIFSIVGIKEREIIENFKLINVSELPKGIYMVKIFSDKGYVVKKLIKN